MTTSLWKRGKRACQAGASPRIAQRLSQAFSSMAVIAGLTLASGVASAAPEAHILRIDPRASMVDGAPVLTTVVEVVQNKRLSEATSACAAMSGNSYLDCTANALEQPQALYSPFEFFEKNALFTVNIAGMDTPASFLSKERWGDEVQKAGSGFGTAWLILLDAGSSMGPRFGEAKNVAATFVNTMGPNDIVDVMIFNDRAIVHDSKWVSNKTAALNVINSVGSPFPMQGRTRPLGTILKNAVTDGFKDLGNAGSGIQVPMHQALVVLSTGAAGADATSNAAFSNVLRDYLTKGRFPENNSVLPKTPVPTISVWFPSDQIEEIGANAREFMEGLANTEIGGFYSIIRAGQASRAAKVVNAVRTRFNQMHVVKWRVSCIAPSITQSFSLVFQNTNPPIAGDSTFQNVPVGIDPTTWPLDIDIDATVAAAKKSPLYPGGTVKIFGNFCWGGNQQYAEVYMVPNNQAAPASLQGGSIEDAKKAQRTLIEAGMRGKATSAGDSFVEAVLPDSEKFLTGTDEAMTARLIVYDNHAHRTSAVTADKILTLRASRAPFPYLMVGGATFGGVVILLLLVNVVRGGGGGRGNAKRRGSSAAAPPRPIIVGGGGGGGYAPPAPGPVGGATRANLSGPPGLFTILPGMEMRAGRDGAACQILLNEPRVSGTHASLKLEGGQLYVRDEGSNNGTYVNGSRIPAGTWSPVGQGASLKFGPIEFSVRLE